MCVQKYRININVNVRIHACMSIHVFISRPVNGDTLIEISAP